MHNTFSRNLIEQAIANTGGEVALRDEYSGRGYGAAGFGLVLDGSIGSFVAELAQIISSEYDDSDERYDAMNSLINLMDAAREDSMGRSNITYFPGWTLED